eukprot:PhM_4_TR4984/c0_g1_i1/m.85388
MILSTSPLRSSIFMALTRSPAWLYFWHARCHDSCILATLAIFLSCAMRNSSSCSLSVLGSVMASASSSVSFTPRSRHSWSASVYAFACVSIPTALSNCPCETKKVSTDLEHVRVGGAVERLGDALECVEEACLDARLEGLTKVTALVVQGHGLVEKPALFEVRGGVQQHRRVIALEALRHDLTDKIALACDADAVLQGAGDAEEIDRLLDVALVFVKAREVVRGGATARRGACALDELQGLVQLWRVRGAQEPHAAERVLGRFVVLAGQLSVARGFEVLGPPGEERRVLGGDDEGLELVKSTVLEHHAGYLDAVAATVAVAADGGVDVTVTLQVLCFCKVGCLQMDAVVLFSDGNSVVVAPKRLEHFI